MQWAAIQGHLKPGETLVPETLWDKLCRKLLESVPRLPLSRFERLWIPFADAISQSVQGSDPDPRFELLEKVLDMKRHHFELVSAFLRSFLTRAYGVGCEESLRGLITLRVLNNKIEDKESLEELLGKELWGKLGPLQMEAWYDDSMAGGGPRPASGFKVCHAAVEPVSTGKRKRGRMEEIWCSSWEAKRVKN
ncbi:hypothetical protein QBC40DRAFT_259735 [Triangularia verruculosa]|uniref:Uncharacterized protein n=1 Tax=Triangularia verruculosa TaxID=2587418 RepID=A0AAN6X602_9PEZI|nr:hypothetical protein QBC40DRAFT_259735 [Triangularia verruculosa]